MGSAPNSRPVKIYGTLLRLYPQSFQKQYGPTMEVTFSDMLEGERTGLGRIMVWTRAMFDLPVSATREHITNGKDIHMNRNTKIILLGACIAILIVGLGSFWEGNLHARQSVGIERVTAGQLADAMQQDSFYSDFGNAAVLFSANAESVKTHGNASLVTFTTGRPFNVVCQFPKAVSFKSGQKVSVAAPAGSAERETHGVLLHNCLEN